MCACISSNRSSCRLGSQHFQEYAAAIAAQLHAAHACPCATCTRPYTLATAVFLGSIGHPNRHNALMQHSPSGRSGSGCWLLVQHAPQLLLMAIVVLPLTSAYCLLLFTLSACSGPCSVDSNHMTKSTPNCLFLQGAAGAAACCECRRRRCC
jgi:hypothetical protein